MSIADRLRDELLGRGATEAEIARSEADGTLVPLAIDHKLLAGRAVYNRVQFAEAAGVDLEVADALWRALGFPAVSDDVVRFTVTDVDMIRAWVDQAGHTVFRDFDRDELIQRTRVVSGFLARLAEHQADTLVEGARAGRERGMSDDEIALELLERVDLDALLGLLEYSLRLQLRDAVWRRMATERPDEVGAVTLAVGFVDLAGYTSMAQQLDEEELSALVGGFEEIAHETVVRHGGRIVKTIGDEVMFVTDDPGAAASTAFELVQQVEEHPDLIGARAGVAYGRVIARDADYFGPVVNLGHRITGIAFPNSVVVSESVIEALRDDERFEFRSLRKRRIRDVGAVPLWSVRAVPE